MQLNPTDIAVILVYLIGTTLFGAYLGRGQRNVNDYFVSGRGVPWWAVAISIVATETSTVTFISVPGFAFAAGASGEGGNFTFMQLVCGYMIGRIVISLLFIPLFFRGQLLTVYQVLTGRFGEKVRRAASSLFLMTRSLADGFRLFATAIVLVALTGWSDPLSILIIGAATILYTYLGGMKAVIWTDVIQFFIYVGGAIVAAFFLLDRIPGGWSEVSTMAAESDSFRFFDFTWDITRRYTFWSGVLGGAFLTTATHGTDQLMVQRYLCSKTSRQATAALLVSGVIVFAQFLLFLLIGVMLKLFYTHFPPTETFAGSDRVFPHFIVTELPPGVVGLIIAAVFAAAMSTLSSSLNSSSAAAVTDFYRPMRSRRQDAHYLSVARWMTLLWGVVQISMALLAGSLSRRVVDEVLGIASFTNGAILGVFLLGTLTKRVRQNAALVGMGAGIVLMLYVRIFTHTAWPWYVLIGSLTTFFAGWLASRVLESSTEMGEAQASTIEVK
jgi:SSS family transporter